MAIQENQNFTLLVLATAVARNQQTRKCVKSIELGGHDENSLNKLNLISFKINKK